MDRLRFELRSKTLFTVGCALVLLGVAMPALLRVDNFRVYDDLFRALQLEQSVYVLSAAMRLLALNILRAYPHYLGAFCVVDSIRQTSGRKIYSLLYLPMISLIIVAVYGLIGRLYGIQYDLGVPAVLMMLSLFLLLRIDFDMVAPTKKAVMIFFLLCTVQCLDVMPALNGLGFGRGEASEAIKEIAAFLGVEGTLNVAGVVVMSIMGINVGLYAGLVSDENRIKTVSLQREQQERELMKIRVQAVEARNHLELSRLVHDFKTPLTAIQTLIGIVKFDETDAKHIELLTQAEASVERLSELISEFLDEQHFSRVTVQEIVRDLKAQISSMAYAPMLTYEVPEEEIPLEVNKIRILRMLINLIENAYYAVDPQRGSIRLAVQTDVLDGVEVARFALSDNGVGMDRQTQSAIFESGYSGRGSSGLGLGFVRQVVEAHHGRIDLCSAPGGGTTFYISIPLEA